jgi:hypothetical protein
MADVQAPVSSSTPTATSSAPPTANVAAVKSNVVMDDRRRFQLIDQDEREVMTFDRERGRSPTQYFHFARRTRLDPEARALRARVPEDRSEHELGPLREILFLGHRFDEQNGSLLKFCGSARR